MSVQGSKMSEWVKFVLKPPLCEPRGVFKSIVDIIMMCRTELEKLGDVGSRARDHHSSRRLGLKCGFEPSGLDRPGRLPHQQGLCEARLGYQDESPQLGAPGPESSE